MKRLLLCLLMCIVMGPNVGAQQSGAQRSNTQQPITQQPTVQQPSAPAANAQQGSAQSSSAQPADGQAASATQNDPDAPATKEEVEAYFAVAHTRELATKVTAAMVKPMQQMMHDTYLKNKEKLPSDFEARMGKETEEMMQNMPFDEMIDAMMPSYQKHFTRGDMEALTAFYSSTTGQKLLKELPAITAEAMQNMIPILQKYTSSMQQRLQEQVAQMLQQSAPQAAKNPPATAN
jgi:hypothetical protein